MTPRLKFLVVAIWIAILAAATPLALQIGDVQNNDTLGALSDSAEVDVDADLPGRLPAPVESAAYFAVAETLANVVKHSGARSASVRMHHRDGVLTLRVRDDGSGGADPVGGTGLRGIERRLASFDGTMAVSSPAGGPTVVTMELPCALSSPKTSPSFATD